MLTDDPFLDLHYASIVLATVVPLFYWFVLKKRQSHLYRIARGIQLLNAIFYIAGTYYVYELFWNDLELGWPLTIVMPLIAYLLAKRWAPKGAGTTPRASVTAVSTADPHSNTHK